MDWTLVVMLAVFLAGSLLTWLGQRMGWPLLVLLANWIKGIADKDNDGKPDVLEGNPPTPVPAVEAAALSQGGHPVALPAWLAMLWPILATLLGPVIEQALKALQERLGRSPTAEEERREIEQVYERVRKGRVRVSLLADED